jgi:hypothetical protein
MYFGGAARARSICLAHLYLLWERIPKHRQPALGLFPRGFVLKDIPVFDQNSIPDAQDVRRDPIHRPA